MCGGGPLELLFRYDERPDGETDFQIPPDRYRRDFLSCRNCAHTVADLHDLDLDELYSGGYVDATYSADGIASTYEKIMGLPPERSDNVQRVARVDGWWRSAGREPGSVLDVGAGLGVFPARMKEAGWEVTALDPDERAVAHAREHIGVEAVCADFMEEDSLGRFDLVTFNKVLEHVPDPVAMLARTRANLEPGGAVYVELPDGEMAATDPDGPGREEFFIEHLRAFSIASLSLLALHAGFRVVGAGRLREPSGKYTLYGFVTPA